VNTLSTTLRYEIWIFLLGLVAVISYRLLTGRINMKSLLSDKSTRRQFSPARLQLLLFTLGGALYYLILIIENKRQGRFPDIPNEFLLLMSGSHTFYLGSKLMPLLASVFGHESLRKK
jgi:hypothetical protein